LNQILNERSALAIEKVYETWLFITVIVKSVEKLVIVDNRATLVNDCAGQA
jgi:hypothetical protein